MESTSSSEAGRKEKRDPPAKSEKDELHARGRLNARSGCCVVTVLDSEGGSLEFSRS